MGSALRSPFQQSARGSVVGSAPQKGKPNAWLLGSFRVSVGERRRAAPCEGTVSKEGEDAGRRCNYIEVLALQRRVDELGEEVRARSAERDEAMQRERALAEVLQAINSSPQAPTAVFDAILGRVMRLCAAAFGYLMTYEGERFQVVAAQGLPAPFAEYLRNMDQPGSTGLYAAIRRGSAYGQVADLREGDVYGTSPLRRALVDLGGARTGIVVALKKDDSLLGVITIYRQEVRPFADSEVVLLQNFAEQAVIAIENSRLLGELRESETRHALVSDAVAEGIYEWNIETSALWVSQRLIEIFGFEGRELKAADWNELVHPEDFSRYRSALRDCFKGIARRLDCEYRVRHADGAYRWIEDRGVPVRNAAGQAVRLVGALTDVTARKESERALSEALERQTATAQVLQVINESPGDLVPVFEAMLERAVGLGEASFGIMNVYEDGEFRAVALHGVPDGLIEQWAAAPRPSARNALTRMVNGEDVVHIDDLAAYETYQTGDLRTRALVEVGGARSLLAVALRKDGAFLGSITAYRQEVRPFTDKQIALLQNFAAQAVIAMENARLLGELHESLEQQTATAEVLQVINSSPGNLGPVFEAILEKALHVCGASFGGLWTFQGDRYVVAALRNVPDAYADFLRTTTLVPGPGTAPYRFLHGERSVIQNIDLAAEEPYRTGDPQRRALVDLGGARSALQVPLCKDDTVIGIATIYRQEVQAFDERQIALLQSFAAQAVIAIQNARLLSELRASLEQQTATAEVLKTISRSAVNLETVLDTLVETVARLCRADQSYMFRSRDGLHHLMASHGLPDEAIDYLNNNPFEPNEGTTSGRVVLQERTVHIRDVLQDEKYTYSGGQKVAGFRTMLGIPLMAQDKMVGVFVVSRTHVEPFSEKEIALATGFADQAVIAIENARLFEELRDRQAELRVTFDNMGDGVVMFDADLRLASWNRNFQELLDVPDSFLASRPGLEEYVRLLVQRGELGDRDPDKEVARYRDRAARQWSAERTRPDGRVLEVRNNPVPGGGAVLIYSDITRRKKAEAEIRIARDAAEAALERQTATADILKVIASSPTDVQPVLEAVAKAAVRFCGATDANVHMRDGDEVLNAAHAGPLRASLIRRPLDRQTGFGTAILEGRTVQIPDIQALDPVQFALSRRLAAEFGFRAALAAPLLRENTAIGAISLRRTEPGSFTPQQILLLETFAAQAVIAVENVRLFTELRESLEQQTASAEILEVISQSPTDVQPVLKAVAAAARRFCGAEDASISLREDPDVVLAAHDGELPGEPMGTRNPIDQGTIRGRSIMDAATVHMPDVLALDAREYGAAQRLARKLGFRAIVSTPMLRDSGAIGCVTLRKADPVAFTQRQIALLETFAAQAVIAIENVRLFTELRETLEQQTATAEILTVISQSPTDVDPVLSAVAKAALKFCGASDAQVFLREGDEWLLAAHEGPIGAHVGRRKLTRQTAPSRAIIDGEVVQIVDLQAVDADEFSEARELGARLGFRSALAAPLLRDDVSIGAISLRRREAGEFDTAPDRAA